MTIRAEGKFVKKLMAPMPRHGQYRGMGRLELTETGLRIEGSHVMTLGERWLAGIIIGTVALLLTGGLGLVFLYLILEYALVRRGDRDLSFSQIRDVAYDPARQLIAIDFDAPRHVTPAVLRSPDAETLYTDLVRRMRRAGL